MDQKISPFMPEVGLEAIEWLDGPTPQLPPQPEAQLAGSPIRHWVGELFAPANLDWTLRRFAQPRLRDPDLLLPARFESLVRDSARLLDELAERDQDPVLVAAGRFLGQQIELRDLLARYRTLLIKA